MMKFINHLFIYLRFFQKICDFRLIGECERQNNERAYKMNVEYRNKKDLPCEELYNLFLAVGWANEDSTTQEMIDNFNIGFINSTFVFSAWIDNRLVGCVRVLSDLHFRSVILDLAVLPEFQKKGIGREMVHRCREACQSSEWLVQTDMAKGFYEKIGFKVNNDHFLSIPCKWF